MNEDRFRSELEDSGFECSHFEIEPNRQRKDHSHPWHARLLVLEGELTMVTADGEESIGAGATCAMAAHRLHAEITGPTGARGLIGKKAP